MHYSNSSPIKTSEPKGLIVNGEWAIVNDFTSNLMAI